jgi:hypothetical protein
MATVSDGHREFLAEMRQRVSASLVKLLPG